MMQAALLFLLGAGVGAYGTLIGAGGGFVLVPLLLLLYPNESPLTITTISLAVVCANAVSGSVAYARLKRIDYQTGRLFALATIPGAVIGVFATGLFSRGTVRQAARCAADPARARARAAPRGGGPAGSEHERLDAAHAGRCDRHDL